MCILKIVLGTAQFGMNYGINNKRGKVPQNEVHEILDFAYNKNIHFLDTASSYGDSETVIGNYIKKNSNQFNIITKFVLKENEDFGKSLFAICSSSEPIRQLLPTLRC